MYIDKNGYIGETPEMDNTEERLTVFKLFNAYGGFKQ